MRFLVDTDAFCKLGISGLLHDSARVLGGDISDCARLAGLPHMLRRGSLPRRYGAQACRELLPLADQLPTAPPSSTHWLDRLAADPEIDPGEAQLFGAAADHPLIVLTGDNRALRALKKIDELTSVLARRVVPCEAILLALCSDLGSEAVRRRLTPLLAVDKMVGV